MKNKSLLAVIVVLLCFCLSSGSGDEHIERVRKSLQKRYSQLAYSMENQKSLPPAKTIINYLRDIRNKEKNWQNWLPEDTGYSLEHLNHLQGSDKNLMSEDELQLAAECHIWHSAWYLVRFIAFHKAAEREGKIDDVYPNKYECRGAAYIAFRNWKHHDDIYLQYLKALDENVRKDLLKKHKFSSYVHSQEQFYNNPVSNDILNVMIHLEDLIRGLLRRKTSMNTSAVKECKNLAFYLTPKGKRLQKNMMIKLRNCFSVEDLSQLTDSSDVTFLEVGWLFNRYRSLRHEIRCHEFLKFLRQWKGGKAGFSIKRLKNAIQVEQAHSIHYGSLAVDFCNIFNKHQPDRVIIFQDIPLSSDFVEVDRQIHISEDEGLEQRKGKQKRKTLKKLRKMVSKPLDASKRLKCLASDIQTGIHQKQQRKDLDDGQIHIGQIQWSGKRKRTRLTTTKRYKSPKADIQTTVHQAKQRKSLGEVKGPADFQRPTANLKNEDNQAPFFLDVVQDAANHKQQPSPNDESTPLGADLFTKVNQHGITPKVFYEPGLEDEIFYDYRYTNDEPLDVLFQPALPDLDPSFWENCQSHTLITGIEDPSVASFTFVEHFQANRPLANHDTQLETNAMEVEVLQQSLSLNEIRESEYSGFDSWLKNFLQHETPGGSAVHEMTLLGQSGTLGPDIIHGACGPNVGFQNIIENECAEERQGRVEWSKKAYLT